MLVDDFENDFSLCCVCLLYTSRRAGKAGIVVFDDAPAFRQQGIGVLEHRIIGFE